MANIPLGGTPEKAILAIMVGDRLVVEEQGEPISYLIDSIIGDHTEATINLISEDEHRIEKTIEYVRVD